MRDRISLMKEWTFIGPDKIRRRVDLPHTWNAVDGQDGGNDYYRGACQYEKVIACPAYDPEKEAVYLQFHGVNASALVHLNGKRVIEHDNGYSTFRADVTALLQQGENLLTVRVDNSVNEHVYPQVADFTFYGGIYREVEFLIVNKAHFDLDHFGGPGIRVTPTVTLGDEKKGTGNTASVKIDAWIGKQTDPTGLTVNLALCDAEGHVVEQTMQQAAPQVSDTFELASVHLWDGIDDPYLYEVRATLLDGQTVLDEVTAPCGFRSYRIDRKKGFFLNGRAYPLHGVSRHQDRRGLGNALTQEMMDEDFAMIREIGANTVRLAHYQHHQHVYDLCDRYGFVVWAEIPYISAHMPNADANTFFQMEELIVQNYNHPSICVWGISNEITISRKHKRRMLANHKKLNAFVKELDPTRPTTLACYAVCTPFHPVSKITDLVGWNLYLGWYVPGMFLNDLWMGFYHLFYSRIPLCYSEYGAEAMPNLHSAHPRRNDHTEEYQSLYHEYMLRCFRRHPELWATYCWNMFDFAADARDQGGEPGMNHKGLVTFDRKVKKDSFYLYKAWWNPEPMVHICGKRFEKRPGSSTEIRVYSNQPTVKLYVDGMLIEEQSERAKKDHVFVFNVKLGRETRITAEAGGLTDSAEFTRVDRLPAEYKVKKSGQKSNWT